MGDAGKKIRLGIIGTGRIAARFVPEAKIIDAIEVACVYNPRLPGAEDFAKTHGITKAAGRMEEFLSEVDAAYIAGPHGTHVPYARQLLLEGKHVLCEKPMAFTAKEAEELFALAAEKGLVLMEAIKTAYCPGFRALVETVQSGAIGEVYDVEACFTKLSPSNVREVWDERYGGSFPELGAYSLLPVVKILGTGNQGIEFQSIPMGNGKDGYTKAIIRYPRGMAFAKTGLSVKSEGQLLVSGSRGYVLAEAPWWLTKKFEVRYEDPSRREVYEFPFEGAGLRYEIQAFTERILADGPGEAGETGKINNDEGDATGVMPKEGIWIARQMEAFLASREKEYGACEAGTEHGTAQPGRNASQGKSWSEGKVGIWAHRGCSMRYPENTLEAFEAAAAIKGLAGIELDVQLTKDGELVVIHDETVDRTTNGTGEVRSYTLSELKNLVIQGRGGRTASIPTLEEVFRLLQPICKNEGLLINIELKNSNIRYEGMEEKVLALVERYGLNANIVYSSFLPESMGLIRQLNPAVKTGILGRDALQCLKEMRRMQADAIHPWNGGLPLNEADIEKMQGIPVRVWNGEEPLYGQNHPLKETRMTKYALLGATDIITNVPENYLR